MYAVIELQKSNNNLSTIIETYRELNQAESKYHQILMYAAVSHLDIHSASLLDETGRCLFYQSYMHSEEE